jgi:hypothetical protein
MSTNLKSIKIDFTSFFVKIRVIRGLFLFLFLNAVALGYSAIDIRSPREFMKYEN